MKPLVYIAAPYSSDLVANTRAAILQGISLWRTGTITPLIPHLTLLADLLAPMPVEQWYALDCEQLRRCDAVFRMPGVSTGADEEVAFAAANGIPVFTDRDALLDWAADR